jgi:hypothetical protein
VIRKSAKRFSGKILLEIEAKARSISSRFVARKSIASAAEVDGRAPIGR